jgi:hypothetical protein
VPDPRVGGDLLAVDQQRVVEVPDGEAAVDSELPGLDSRRSRPSVEVA